MNSLYHILAFCILSCLGINAQAQFSHSFGVGGQGSSSYQNVVITFPPSLKIKPSGTIRWKTTPLKSKKVHLLEGHKTRLGFEMTAQNLPPKAILSFEVLATGNFMLTRNNNIFEYNPEDTSPDWPEVDFSSNGSGQIKFTLIEVKVDGTPFNIDPSRKSVSFTYDLVYFQDALNEINRVPLSKTPQYLTQVSNFHDTWDKVFKYEGWEDPSGIAIGLFSARSKLDKLFKDMKAKTTTGTAEERLIATTEFYDLFHDIPGSHPGITTYGIASRTAMNDLDESVWRTIDQSDLRSLDSYLAGIDQIEGYVSAHGTKAQSQFNSLFSNAYRQAQSNGSRQAYCDFYDLIKGTAFARNNQGDSRIKEAITKCEISPCEAACNSGNCEAVFANCDPNSPCFRKCKERQNATLSKKACQDQFLALETAFDEGQINIGEIMLLITQLREDCSQFLSSDQLAQIDTIEQRIEPCKIEFVELAPTKISDQEFSFKLLVVSGINIQLESIDDRPLPPAVIDSSGTEVQYTWQGYPVRVIWLIPDSLLRIIITDGKNHEVLFRAASGDSVKLPLDQAEFTANANLGETSVLLHLENGSEPFWLEWHAKEGDQVIYQSLDSRDATIDFGNLPETYSGAYSLVVRDRFGRKIELKEEVLIERPFSLKLWHWLLIPLFLMVGFLIYRNIFGLPKPSTI